MTEQKMPSHKPLTALTSNPDLHGFDFNFAFQMSSCCLQTAVADCQTAQEHLIRNSEKEIEHSTKTVNVLILAVSFVFCETTPMSDTDSLFKLSAAYQNTEVQT